jgi:hypothetical protein
MRNRARQWFAGGIAASLATVAGAQSFQPGMWQTTNNVTDVTMPGAPPQVLAMMKRTTTINHCVTPEEAAKNPRALMQTNKSCTITRFSMAGGHLDSAMSCQQQGGVMTMTSSGTYTPTSYAMISHMIMSGRSGMKMTARVNGKLTGPCK